MGSLVAVGIAAVGAIHLYGDGSPFGSAAAVAQFNGEFSSYSKFTGACSSISIESNASEAAERFVSC